MKIRSLLENINKIQICKNCGHIVKLSTERPGALPSNYINVNGSIISMEATSIEAKDKSQSELVFPDSLMDLQPAIQQKSEEKIIKPIPIPTTPTQKYRDHNAKHSSIMNSRDNPIAADPIHIIENQENLGRQRVVPGYNDFIDFPSKPNSIRTSLHKEKSFQPTRPYIGREYNSNSSDEKLPSISKPKPEIKEYVPDKKQIEEIKKD